MNSPTLDTIIHIDGVPVSSEAAEVAMRLADKTGKTHYAGFEWTWMPCERRHRETDKSVITDSYEVIKASCGRFVHFPPKNSATVTPRAARPISYTIQVWQGATQANVKWSDDLKALECTLHHVQLISVEGSSEWYPCSVCELEGK